MLDKSFIEEKLKNIKEYLLEIEEILKADEKEIIKDFRSVKSLERNFQLIVDEIIDINIYFIRELDLSAPDDFQSSFENLVKGKILPSEFALKIAPVVGLRNLLVHRYEKIDKDIFVRQVKKEYSDFIKYIKYINDYLKSI